MSVLSTRLMWAFLVVVLLFLFALGVIRAGYAYHKWMHHVPSVMDAHMDTVYNPLYHTYLLALLRVMDSEASRLKCEYWITSGTLLGFARIGGILPFDDDVDICMKESELRRFVQGVNDDPASPLLLFQREPTGSIWRVRYRDSALHEALGKVDIDVFPMRDEQREGSGDADDCKQVVAVGYLRAAFPNERFFVNELRPLRRVMLNDVHVWAPKFQDPYLDRSYKGWRETIYITHVHSNFLCGLYLWLFQRKKKIPITPQLTADLKTLVAQTRAHRPIVRKYLPSSAKKAAQQSTKKGTEKG